MYEKFNGNFAVVDSLEMECVEIENRFKNDKKYFRFQTNAAPNRYEVVH